MAKIITKEQEDKYVKCWGNKCPHCESTNVEGGKFESDNDWVTRAVVCNDCGEEWTDQYQLVGILETSVQGLTLLENNRRH